LETRLIVVPILFVDVYCPCLPIFFFSLALKPPWALASVFQFHVHFTDGRTPWTSDQLVAILPSNMVINFSCFSKRSGASSLHDYVASFDIIVSLPPFVLIQVVFVHHCFSWYHSVYTYEWSQKPRSRCLCFPLSFFP
jgi:hypothetical protein